MISVEIQTPERDMRSVVNGVKFDISLMSDSRVTREYKLHELFEVIHLDKSCN